MFSFAGLSRVMTKFKVFDATVLWADCGHLGRQVRCIVRGQYFWNVYEMCCTYNTYINCPLISVIAILYRKLSDQWFAADDLNIGGIPLTQKMHYNQLFLIYQQIINPSE